MVVSPPGRDAGDQVGLPDPPPGRSPREGPARAVRVAREALAFGVRVAKRTLRFTLLHATLAAVSLAGGLAVVVIAAEYGYQPNRDTAAWAGLAIRYAEAGSCATCHEPEAARNQAAAHAVVNCQACHGPLAGHDGTETAPEALTPGAPHVLEDGTVLGPAREAGEPVCLTCHEAVIGRPTGFPIVSSVTHFPLPTCTVCHDPHEPPAVPPPDIRHPLENLPDCTVCHRPEGIRPMPADHPTWAGDCRACHRSAQALGS